jgi:rhodanese-related sulfurtransferase
VSVAGLAYLLASKDFPLINVHVPYAGEIPGTDTHIPYDQVGQHLDQLPADRGARVVLYCRSGSMSTTSARELVSLGDTDVWTLNGGMNAWHAAGHELITEP